MRPWEVVAFFLPTWVILIVGVVAWITALLLGLYRWAEIVRWVVMLGVCAAFFAIPFVIIALDRWDCWRQVRVSAFPPEHPIHHLPPEQYLRLSRFHECDICGATVCLSANGVEMVHNRKETVKRCRGACGYPSVG